MATGILSLYYGDKKVGEGRIKTQPGDFSLAGEGLCVGRDSGEAVTDDYPGESPHRFTGGTIKRVAVDVSGEPYLDLEREARRCWRGSRRAAGARGPRTAVRRGRRKGGRGCIAAPALGVERRDGSRQRRRRGTRRSVPVADRHRAGDDAQPARRRGPAAGTSRGCSPPPSSACSSSPGWCCSPGGSCLSSSTAARTSGACSRAAPTRSTAGSAGTAPHAGPSMELRTQISAVQRGAASGVLPLALRGVRALYSAVVAIFLAAGFSFFFLWEGPDVRRWVSRHLDAAGRRRSRDHVQSRAHDAALRRAGSPPSALRRR